MGSTEDKNPPQERDKGSGGEDDHATNKSEESPNERQLSRSAQPHETHRPIPSKAKATISSTMSKTDEVPAVIIKNSGQNIQEDKLEPLADTLSGSKTWDEYELDENDWDDEDTDDSRQANARTRQRARRITTALALIAAIGIGFASGVLYQKHNGSSSTPAASNISALAKAFSGASKPGSGSGSFAQVFASRFGSNSNSVAGTVSAISGSTLYVTEGSSSALVKIVTSPSSTVTVPSSAPVSAIQPGDSVVITGAKQSNGSYMAATITDNGNSTASSPTSSPSSSSTGG